MSGCGFAVLVRSVALWKGLLRIGGQVTDSSGWVSFCEAVVVRNGGAGPVVMSHGGQRWACREWHGQFCHGGHGLAGRG